MKDHNMNPWHSRPIDVHRWSDHPEVRGLVDRIWDGFLGEKIAERTRGPKPRMAKLGGNRAFAAGVRVRSFGTESSHLRSTL